MLPCCIFEVKSKVAHTRRMRHWATVTIYGKLPCS